MNNRFSRTKNFVREHKFAIGVGAGVIVGVAALYVIGSKTSGNVFRVAITPENLQNLIDKPESVVTFEMNPRTHIWVINSTTKEVFP